MGVQRKKYKDIRRKENDVNLLSSSTLKKACKSEKHYICASENQIPPTKVYNYIINEPPDNVPRYMTKS